MESKKNIYWIKIQNDDKYVINIARENGNIAIHFNDKENFQVFRGFVSEDGFGEFMGYSAKGIIPKIRGHNENFVEVYKICDERLIQIETQDILFTG